MADNRYKNPPAGPSANRPNEPKANRRNEPRANGPAPEPAARPEPRPAAANVPKAARAAQQAPTAKPTKPPRGPLPGVGNLLSLLRDRRFHLFVGFGLLLGSLYLTIAFTSFLFTGHADQSVVGAMSTIPVKEAGAESHNWLGLLGAWAAELFIYKLFGVAAFALIPVVFFLGYKIVFRTTPVSVSYTLALGLFTMAWLSILMGYVVVTLDGADPVLAHRLDFLCGGVGFEAASWLNSLIGWGTVLLLAFLLISFVVFFFNVTSLNLGSFRRLSTEDDPEEDAELEAEIAAEQAAAVRPAPAPAALAMTLKTRPGAPDSVVSASATVAAGGAQAAASLALELADDTEDEEAFEAPAPAVKEYEPAPRPGAGLPLSVAGTVAAGALGTAAAASSLGTSVAGGALAAAVPLAASGPAFSIEMPTADEPAAAPATPVSTVPTPLSLADLADDDAPLPASRPVLPMPAARPLEITVPGRDDLDPNAGAAIAAVVDEDEDADAMPPGNYDPTLELSRFQFPTLELLNDYGIAKAQVTKEELEANKDRIVETLGHYSIAIASIKATIGPTVTLYEIVPEAGVRISKIKSLEDDIALSLAALGIRIIAPIPGKGTIGIEVPNTKKEMVSIRSVLGSEKFARSEMDLPIAFGRTITNEVFVADLAKMPHLLMAGATGQGKSVGLNVILASLLYKRHPAQLKFVLVDPKKVELSIFNKIERHYLAKLPDTDEAIITDTKKVVNTLNSLCMEMDRRYDLLKEAGCRNLKEYNAKFIERRLNPKKGHRFLPFIVLVIDELADLMMTAGKEVETPIARLAQLARAIGIHLIVATQRPSVNVITGIIKANFPCRISFKVTSKIDSRTILDTGGADQLIGQGDMLFSAGSDLIRVQCAFIDTPEVDRVCDFIGEQQGYSDAYLLPEVAGADGDAGSGNEEMDPSERDSMFEDAARCIVLHQQGSTSLLQRKLKLGYNRAGRLIDQLQHAGIVGPFEGSKARDVLIPDEYQLEQLLNSMK
ncbi:DNA translocase FtsK 4TM domain-containing protein [Hymenobacter sp. DH14]|uniref:DNA translocase FtsK 4TM domain-containing protein n=1 Tax=Hymenobacter cyanobacteriorum TaxID=2926463 RepID=A0A9X2AD95_9BACT|nr:DNA translocase FtsK [Hymenobacter cyanobacteriorum]MCI1185826.1 DNA translocase FtsK 4TM domain-containing protein [Hymenobacter cyanobacteriorum]